VHLISLANLQEMGCIRSFTYPKCSGRQTHPRGPGFGEPNQELSSRGNSRYQSPRPFLNSKISESVSYFNVTLGHTETSKTDALKNSSRPSDYLRLWKLTECSVITTTVRASIRAQRVWSGILSNDCNGFWL
jgi:hypothetical protein